MAKLIDVAQAKAYVEANYQGDPLIRHMFGTLLDKLPRVEVVRGLWEWDTEDIYRCSNCGEKSHVKEVMGQPDWDYCPCCGAKQRR